MSCFDLFQAIHASGGYLKIGPNGTVTGHAPGFGPQIKEHKDAILDALWSDVQLWPAKDEPLDQKLADLIDRYTDEKGVYRGDFVLFDASIFANNLDFFYHEARIAGETVGLRDMIRECFAACRASHDSGVAWVRANKDKVMELVDEVVTGQKMLNGRELVDVASEIFQVIE
jgi:hypothetical protein